MIFNNTGLTKDNIIFDFDISNIKSFDNNAGFSVTSLTFWENYILSDLTLTGYGQTMYDFGLATSLTQTKTFTKRDRNLVFQRLGYNDGEGNTTFPQILTNSGNEGNSFELSGGYLSTYFKLHDKYYQLAKYRTDNGFTIDTWLYIDQDTFDNINSFTDGFFLYLGAKSENKFNIAFSGANDDISKITYDTNSYLPDIEYNSVGLKFNNDKTISLRYLVESGFTVEYKTDEPVLATGWTNIVTTFRYCKKIKDYEGDNLIDCVPRRDGFFKIFVNGKLFYELDNTEEFFWLRPLSIDADRQIGIPFTINWGGGTWGLKHSYVDAFSSATVTENIITGRDFIYQSGYSLENLSGYSYTLVTGQTLFNDGDFGTFETAINNVTTDLVNSLLLSSSTQVFSGSGSLLLTYNEYTASTFSSITDNLLKFTQPIEIKPYKRYLYTTNLYDHDSFNCYINEISLGFIENLDSEITVITSHTYSTIEDLPNTWSNIIFEFQTPQVITGLTAYTPAVKIEDLTAGTRFYELYFDGFTFDEYDVQLTGGTSQIEYGDTNTLSAATTGATTDVLYNLFTTVLSQTGSTLLMNVSPTTVVSSATISASTNLINDIYQAGNVITEVYNGLLEISADHPYQCETTLKLSNSSASTLSYTSDTNNLLLINTLPAPIFGTTGITVNPNCRYVYTAKFYDDNSFTGSNKSVFLSFQGGLDPENTILTSVTYDNTVQKRKWVDLKLEFTTPSAFTGITNYLPSVKVDFIFDLVNDYKFYFDEISIIEYSPTIVENTISTSGLTFSATGDNLLIFNPVNIIPDRKYIYKGKFYDDNSYNSGQTKGVYLTFSGGLDSENIVISSLTYTTTTPSQTWTDLKLEFLSPSVITGNTSYLPVIKFTNPTGISINYKFYFDDFVFEQYKVSGNTNYFLNGDNGSFENDITGVTSDVIDIIIDSSTAVTYSGNYALKLKPVDPITSITYLSGYATSYTYFFNTASTIDFETSISGVTTDVLDVVITSSTEQFFSGLTSLILTASTSSTKTIYEYVSAGTILYDFEGSISGFTTEISAATLTSSTEQFSNQYFTSTTSLKLFGDSSGITITTGLTLDTFNPISDFNRPDNIPTGQIFDFENLVEYQYKLANNNTAGLDPYDISLPYSGIAGLKIIPYPQINSYLPFFSIDNNLFYFKKPVTLIPNTEYYYEGNVYDYTSTSIYLTTSYTITDLSGNTTSVSAYTREIAQTWTGSNKGIYLDTIPALDPEITVLSAQTLTYTSNTSANTWTKLVYVFKTPPIMTGQSTYRFSTSIDHEEDLDEPLITNFIFTAGTTSALTVTSLTINNLGYRFHFDDYFVTSATINVYTSFTLSSATDILVNFSSFTITSDTKYVLSTEFYDDNSYLPNEEKGVILEIANGLDSENTIVSSLTYTTSTSSQTWVNLSLEFNTPSALTGTTTYVPVAKLYNKSGISSSYKFYFDNFTITNYPLTPFTSFTFSSLTNSLLTLSSFTPEINKKYVISAKFFDDNSYNTGETKGVYIGFLPPLDSEHTFVSSLTYTTTTASGIWNDLKIEFNTPIQITGNTSYTPYVFVDNPTGINQSYKFYFDEIYTEDYNLLPVLSLTGFSYVYDTGFTKTFESSIENVSSETINAILELSTEQYFSGNSSLKLALPSLVITQYTSNTLTINDANFGEFEDSGHTLGITTGITIDLIDGIFEALAFSGVGNPSAFILNIRNNDLTGNTFNSPSNTLFTFTDPKPINPSKVYILETRFNDFFSFVSTYKYVDIDFLNLDSENEVLGKTAYTSSDSFNTWYTLRTEIKTPSIITGATSYTLGANVDFGDCFPSIYSFRFDDFKVYEQDIITGLTYSSLTDNIFRFEDININPAKKYTVSTKFYDDNSYLSGESKSVYIDFEPTLSGENIILTSITYNDSVSSNTWVDLTVEFTTPEVISGFTIYTPVIKVGNTTAITENYKFYIDNYSVNEFNPVPDSITGLTATTFSSLTNNLLIFENPLEIKPNKRYVLGGYFYDDNGFLPNEEKGIYFDFTNPLDSEIEVLTSTTYTTTTSANTWTYLSIDFVTPSEINAYTSYTPVIKFENSTAITSYYNFYFDNIFFREYDVVDLTGTTSYTISTEILYNRGIKSVIEENFDGSFYGKIQRLRMYDIDLPFPEIKKNYNYFSERYGFRKLK
jgi:hypothetical protein